MLQVTALYGVMKFYNMLKAGISWKGPETIELWYQRPGSDFEDQRDDVDDEEDDDDDEDTLLLPYGSSSDSDESLCDFV
jgi:hypothetical protein